MSAERLRQAAAKIRDKASAVDLTHAEWWDIHGAATALRRGGTPSALSDAAHLALWSPPVALAVAVWLDDIGERHKPDPEPAELCLHYEQDCPTGECEDPGYHTVTACWGCYPTWDGMEGRSVYPCAETKAALKVADLILGGAA